MVGIYNQSMSEEGDLPTQNIECFHTQHASPIYCNKPLLTNFSLSSGKKIFLFINY